MAHAEIHVLGSVQGYTTVARSSGVTGDECRELETLSFGDATSAEARARLRTHAVMNGRRLRTGRFAISRMLPGGTDDAGRPTVEVVTLLLPEGAYRSAVRSLGFLADDAGFWTHARSSAQSGVDVPDRPTPAGPVDQAVLRAFDLWFSARRSGAQAVLPESESVTIARLLAHLDPRDLAACRWGIGLLSLSTPADILTYAPGTSLVGARTVLKAAAAGQWHAAEMEHCVYLVEQTRRLPASDSLTATRIEMEATGEQVVDHPVAARGRKSGVGVLRIASISLVFLAMLAIGAAFVFHKGSATPRPPAEGTPTTTKSGSDGGKDADGDSGSSTTGSSSGGTYGQRPDPPQQPTPPPKTGLAGTAPAAPDASVSPSEEVPPADAQPGAPGAGSGPTPSSTPTPPPLDPPQPPPPASAPSPPSDPDSDADGKPDATDPCPEFPNESAVDGDGDGVPDDCDNCPKKANPRGPNRKQADGDGDGVGDACDNCPLMKTDNTGDTDGDGVGDECDCDPDRKETQFERGMKGRDCDEQGNPLPGAGPTSASAPPSPSKPSEVSPVVEGLIKAWKSKDAGLGSGRECETLESALSTLAAVLELLATESGKAREEVKKAIARFRSVTDANSKRMIKSDALRLLAELEGGPIRDMHNSCNKLLNQVLARSPDACLGDDPIVKFGLDMRMAEIVGEVHELGNRNYGFTVDRSMPGKWLQAADGPIKQMWTKWKDLIGDVRNEVDPPPGYKPSQ